IERIAALDVVAALRPHADDGDHDRVLRPEQQQRRQVGGVRDRQRGAAGEGDRQVDLPQRGQAGADQKCGEEDRPGKRAREQVDECRRAGGADRGDVEPRGERLPAPAKFVVSRRHWRGQITGSQLGSPQLVPQTTVSPSLVPQTTVSPSLVPHTTVSPASLVPQTTVSLLSAVPQTTVSPPLVPQTTVSPSLVPHTTVSPASLAPHAPHVIGSPSAVRAAPHRMPVAQALASAIRRPPAATRFPQIKWRLHVEESGKSPPDSDA